jgi:hypothetical protein
VKRAPPAAISDLEARRNEIKIRRNDCQARRNEFQAGRNENQIRRNEIKMQYLCFSKAYLRIGLRLGARLRAGFGGGSPRRFAGFDLELRDDAVHLGEKSFPRGRVVDLFPRRGLAVAIEAVENLEVGRDRLEVAGGDCLGGERLRALEPEELKQRMVRQVVDLLALERVGDDLSHPLLAYPLFAGDVRGRRAEPQPGKDALAPQRLRIGVEPGPRRLGSRILIHVRFSFPPPSAALILKSRSIALISENGKKMSTFC